MYKIVQRSVDVILEQCWYAHCLNLNGLNSCDTHTEILQHDVDRGVPCVGFGGKLWRTVMAAAGD